MQKEFDLSLYLVTDRKIAGNRPQLELIEQALEGKVTIVQLREKELSFEEIVRFGQELHKLTQRYNVPLIINDNVQAALAIGAEGIHVGQSDTNAKDARKLIGPNMILGVSVATAAEAVQAQADGADYLGVGTIFPTQTKLDTGETIGLAGIREIHYAVPNLPLVAIGGINLTNATSIILAGAHGIAVVSAIIGAKDPRLAAQELYSVIARSESDLSRV